MIIESIAIHNYGGYYGEHQLKVADRGLALVMGKNLDEPRMNSNGAGKSTMFEAMDWCLFGVVPKVDHVDSIINEEAGKDTWVRVPLVMDDGRALIVKRARKPADKGQTLRLWVGGETDAHEITALDTKETQRILEEHLGLDREVFHAAVLFGQEDRFNFAEATDKERIDILTRVLQLGQIDEWLVGAKAKAKENEQKIQIARNRQSETEGRLGGLQSQDYSERIAQWEASKQSRVDALERRLVEERSYASTLNMDSGTIASLEAEQAALQQAAPQPPSREGVADLQDQAPDPPDHAPTRELFTKAQSLYYAASGEKQTAESKIREATAGLDDLRQRGVGHCDLCGQLITAEYLDQKATTVASVTETYQLAIQSFQQSMDSHRAEQQGHEQSILLVDQQYAEAVNRHRALVAEREEEIRFLDTAYRNQLAQHQTAVNEKARQVAEAKAVAQAGVQALDAIGRTEKSLVEENQATNPFLEEQAQVAEKLAAMELELKGVTDAAESLEEAQLYFDFWIHAFGPKGMKSYIIDTRLEEMTTAANHWIHLLTGGTFWIRFETQAMGRSTKKLANKFSIRVFRYNPNGSISDRNYASWSGGEKQRVSLGIDLGLARLIASRAAKRYDALIFDEVFKHLDQKGREAVVEMLHVLKSEKSSLFVIDHDTEFQGAFEHRIFAQKQAGRSQIIEESDHGEAQSKDTDGGRDLRTEAIVPRKRKRRQPVEGRA